MKPHNPLSIESRIEFSAWSHVARWDRDGASVEGKGGAFFESFNLYGLLQYQALRTRSDADTFVKGWQISCPSRCLIAWPFFSKWWQWWRGLTALNSACVNEGLHRKCTVYPVSLYNAGNLKVQEIFFLFLAKVKYSTFVFYNYCKHFYYVQLYNFNSAVEQKKGEMVRKMQI